MRARLGTTALVAGIIAGTLGLGTTARAQAPGERADSAPHFAVFGGWAPLDGQYVVRRGLALGGSADFRFSPIPVPLRFSLSFDERTGEYVSRQRGGQASLDLVMRPLAKLFGMRPYLLGGLGIATQAAYYEVIPFSSTSGSSFVHPRQTWAFASAGAGLDIGRMFIQMKLDQPVASQGPVLLPLSVGFRFWD